MNITACSRGQVVAERFFAVAQLQVLYDGHKSDFYNWDIYIFFLFLALHDLFTYMYDLKMPSLFRLQLR